MLVRGVPGHNSFDIIDEIYFVENNYKELPMSGGY